jgi:YidC/Oxa1 family membrane protein insertase
MANLWNVIILRPVLNGLVVLSGILPEAVEFGLAIIIITLVVRLALTPVTIKQTKSTRAMQELQPKMKELQKKYAKNKQKLQQETMKLYKEAGVNPAGCMWPMLVQFPVWIALYQSIMKTLATTPENLLDLAQHLYASDLVYGAIPVNSHFLWLDLGQPDDAHDDADDVRPVYHHVPERTSGLLAGVQPHWYRNAVRGWRGLGLSEARRAIYRRG